MVNEDFTNNLQSGADVILTRRNLLRLSAALAGGLVMLLLACLDGVDYRPYQGEKYYAETMARLQATAATTHIIWGELEAGFGKAALTPKINASQDNVARGEFRALPLAGYGSRHGKFAHGVHDDLYVKAVALRVRQRLGIMVGMDALIVPPEVTDLAIEQLQHETGLTRDQIYLSATHTHAGVGGWGQGKVAEAFAGGFQPGVRLWFADRIVAAVREALRDLKPAEIGQGGFPAPEFIRNRVAGGSGTVDPEFSYILLRQSGGKTAVLGSYAAHATVLSSDLLDFSADYPGCWQRAVEGATGGLAVFLAGGVGSHSPLPPEHGFAGAERMGQALAQKVVAQLPQLALTNAIAFGILGLRVSLPPTNVRLTDGLRLRPWLAREILPVRPSTFLQAFRLGDSVWVSTPCDFSGELVLGIKTDLRHRGINPVITSFNGDYIGYVILPKYYHLDGYESRTMSFFGPNVPDYFDDLIESLALDLYRN